MSDSVQSNQGFSSKQKQELLEIVQQATEPRFVQQKQDLLQTKNELLQAIEQATEPYFDAIKEDLNRQDEHNAEMTEFRKETKESFAEINNRLSSIEQRQIQEQHMLDAHDTGIGSIKKRLAVR